MRCALADIGTGGPVGGDTLDEARLLSGVKGALHRARLSKGNLDQVRQTPGSAWWAGGASHIATLASFGDRLDHLAGANRRTLNK
eukprot:77374-Prorocentrum_minimum.AAC.2